MGVERSEGQGPSAKNDSRLKAQASVTGGERGQPAPKPGHPESARPGDDSSGPAAGGELGRALRKSPRPETEDKFVANSTLPPAGRGPTVNQQQ